MFGNAVNCRSKDHALAVWPKESVGLVVNGEYSPVDNNSPTPEKDFAINPALMLTEGLQAIIHSHPSGKVSPSQQDMAQQIATALPWGIVACNGERADDPMFFGDQVEPPQLLGRPYRIGPSGTDGRGDCYAVIKDWFWLTKQVRLKDVPRDIEGFESETPWYDTLFSSYGWEEISRAEATVGDVVLCKVMQSTTNHAILVLDHGWCLHHAQNRLSREEPLAPWLKFATRIIRYTKA